jgi:trimeric autotransporter adhesin
MKSILAVVFFAAIAIAFSVNVNAATFTVNTTADTQDAAPGNGICADGGGACSLRAAISEANALAGADTITVPSGTHTTLIAGTNENANADGDFDITSPMTINGAGAGSTIIQANALIQTANERVFHILAGSTTVLLRLSAAAEYGSKARRRI